MALQEERQIDRSILLSEIKKQGNAADGDGYCACIVCIQRMHTMRAYYAHMWCMHIVHACCERMLCMPAMHAYYASMLCLNYVDANNCVHDMQALFSTSWEALQALRDRALLLAPRK